MSPIVIKAVSVETTSLETTSLETTSLETTSLEPASFETTSLESLETGPTVVMQDHEAAPPIGIGTYLAAPGTLYNVGNLLSLSAAVVAAILATERSNDIGAAAAGVLVGSWPAVAVTAATLLFFYSGYLYNEAYRSDTEVVSTRRMGDVVTGVAALVLVAGLVGFGESPLMIAAGLMLAGPRLRSGFSSSDWTGSRVANFLPPAGRVLALFALALAVVSGSATFVTFVMMVSFALWLAADLRLNQLGAQ